MARTSSLNRLSCRNPYQTPNSLNCLPPFHWKTLFFTEKHFVESPSQKSAPNKVWSEIILCVIIHCNGNSRCWELLESQCVAPNFSALLCPAEPLLHCESGHLVWNGNGLKAENGFKNWLYIYIYRKNVQKWGKWPPKMQKKRNRLIFLFFHCFGAFFWPCQTVGHFYIFRLEFSHFRLSAHFPFYARRPDLQLLHSCSYNKLRSRRGDVQGCTPRGSCDNTPSKKGPSKGSRDCFREGSKKAF